MKLAEQVITLEQAKKLKELGIDSDSIFYWAFNDRMKSLYFQWDQVDLTKDTETFPAYTVAELGEMLPHVLKDSLGNEHYFGHHKTPWTIWYDQEPDTFNEPLYYGEEYPTEAQARAEALIYLLENNLFPKQ